MYIYHINVRFDAIVYEEKRENIDFGTFAHKKKPCKNFNKYLKKLYKEIFILENPLIKEITIELLNIEL